MTGFDNRELLQSMSDAAKAGIPGMETHPDFQPRITEQQIAAVKRAAWLDHLTCCDRIPVVREWGDVAVERVELFERTYPDGCYGEIEVTYGTRGARAIYGVRNGAPILYAN